MFPLPLREGLKVSFRPHFIGNQLLPDKYKTMTIQYRTLQGKLISKLPLQEERYFP